MYFGLFEKVCMDGFVFGEELFLFLEEGFGFFQFDGQFLGLFLLFSMLFKTSTIHSNIWNPNSFM